MSLALLFPGQGVQYPQMLPWLEREPEARSVLEAMAAALGSDWREHLCDTPWATSSTVAQQLLVGIELAAWACLAPRLEAPVVVAGYSVGELAAFGAAGVFEPLTALRLPRFRAECMDRSARGTSMGLLAVRDMPIETIVQWAARYGLALAIRLGSDSGIVGGPTSSLEAAALDRAIAGGKVTPIAARIASHTPWMQAAAQEFARELAVTTIGSPGSLVVCNFTGAGTRQREQLVHCLAAQISSTVLWDSCMEAVAERNVTCVLEVGPGTSLSTMWRKAYPQVPARSIDEFRSATAVAEWVGKTIGT